MENIEILTKDGYNYLGNNQFFFVPGITLLSIINDIVENNPIDFLRDSVINSGEKDAYLIYNYLSKKYKSKKCILTNFADYISYFGLGKFKLIRVTQKEILFSQDCPTFINLYFKMFGKSPNFCLSELTCGIIKFFLSILYGKKFNLEFIKKGNNFYFRCDILEDNYEYLGDKNIELNGDLLPLNLCGQCKYSVNSSGINYYSDSLILIMPVYFYFDLVEKIKWGYDIKLNTGESLGKLSYIKLLKNDLKHPKDYFKKFSETISFLGYGKINFLNKSFTKISVLSNFKNYSNPKNLNLVNIKYFIALMYKGFYESVYNVTTKLEIDGFNVTLIKIADGCELTDVNLKLFKNIKLKV